MPCPFFTEEYIAAKGALLSAIIEIYKLTKHAPKVVNEQTTSALLIKKAVASAKVARENAEKLVRTKAGKGDIKRALNESITSSTDKKMDIEKAVLEQVKRKAYALAVDSMLLGRAINESKDFAAMSSFEGEVLEEAYKNLRNNLVESAMVVLENVIEK